MKNILLTWDAYNNGFTVTARILLQLQKENNINIDEIIYLQNQDLSKENLFEIDVFFGKKKYGEVKKTFKDEKILTRIRDCDRIKDEVLLNYQLPSFIQERVNIKSVTHYQSIFDSLVVFVKEKLYQDNFQLHINVSPGTPQMHVVWLMLNASGYLPANTILWSSQWNKKKEKVVLNRVNFKPKSFLSEILKSKYLTKYSPIINPNDTKSKYRQEAENKIEIFAHIPNAPILLIGERGTGKSTYVRTLIKGYQDSHKQFAELACGTFSEELLRSELFGFKKGSFTGANIDKEGVLTKFKNGGILFLDEIQDLSKPLQRQLIQVLQIGEFYPIGANEPIKVNFRLVTATNLTFYDLHTRLDLDFLDRISRFIVEIPPLRLCLDDLENYWSSTWKEIACYEDSPALIWNKKLDDLIKKLELKRNFRDLQKIASYIMAFYHTYKNKNIAIDETIKEFTKWDIDIEANTDRAYFVKDAPYKEIVANFNKDLAKWAINEYGSKKQASEKLERSISMLSKDLAMERINKKK